MRRKPALLFKSIQGALGKASLGRRDDGTEHLDTVGTMTLRFEASCPDGLCPGWSIILKGEPLSEASKFEINFMCERDDRIAFHFNPRFMESDIVCNSFMSNRWGQEERCSNFPFGADEPFQIEIYSDNENFHVYIDDTKIMQYKHRVEDLKTITKVQVANDVNISSLEITKKPFY